MLYVSFLCFLILSSVVEMEQIDLNLIYVFEGTKHQSHQDYMDKADKARSARLSTGSSTTR